MVWVLLLCSGNICNYPLLDLIDIVTSQSLPTTDFRNGAFLLVDKPAGWTSFDVVNKIRGTLRHAYDIRKIKVGHAGTLDPLATGLLLICTGKYTKRLSELEGLDKEYTGEMILGGTTASYDSETPVENVMPYSHITEEEILITTSEFKGAIAQIPPMYSAIKMDGKPLYIKARKGEEVFREPRNVHVEAFEIIEIALPIIKFRISCSKGTYVRTLVHDLGQLLKCGAYMTALRRTRVGPYRIEDAWTVDELTAQIGLINL
jgi:tRNA pseudouridine55 synthase